jgi:hypothetical protein
MKYNPFFGMDLIEIELNPMCNQHLMCDQRPIESDKSNLNFITNRFS